MLIDKCVDLFQGRLVLFVIFESQDLSSCKSKLTGRVLLLFLVKWGEGEIGKVNLLADSEGR